MDKVVDGAVVVIVLVVVIPLLVLSWRRRKTRQAEFDAVGPMPADAGTTRATADGLYLATTPRGDRLDRIAVGGLGFRARLTVRIADAGVTLPMPDRDVFIPAADLLEVDTASWAIDRGIEPGGITVIAWRLGEREVESFVRFDDARPAEAALRALVPIPVQNGGDTL